MPDQPQPRFNEVIPRSPPPGEKQASDAPSSSILLHWTSAAQRALHDHLKLFQAFFSSEADSDPTTDQVLGMLSTSCMLTTDSALLLIRHARLWDAEMLVRSVLEGTYKFAHLCVRDAVERRRRVEEYWDFLPEAGRLRRHTRAQRLLQSVPDPQADEWRPIRDFVMDPAEVAELQSRYPAKLRKLLERRWSFSEIAHALTSSGLPGAEHFAAIMHTYGISSHVTHQSAEAVQMILERNQREPERIEAIVLAHAAREISDLLSLAFFRVAAAYALKSISLDSVLKTRVSYDPLFENLRAAAHAWHAVEYGQARPEDA